MASIQVSGNGSQTTNETSGSYKGVFVSATATTPGDLTHTVMKGIRCTVNLYTPSGSFTIHSGQAWPLAMGNNPGSNEGNVSNSYNSLYIDWGGIVNVGQNDRIQIQLDVASSATGQVTTATLVPATGIGYYVPQLLLYSVNLNNATQTFPAGDNVTKVAVVTDGSADVITKINASSDIWSADFSVPDFRALQASDYPYAFATGDIVYNVYDGPEAQRFKLELSVDTGQTADCFIVSFAGVRTKEITEKATRLAVKIAGEVSERYM